VTYDSIDVHVLADKGSCQSVVFRRHVLPPVADRHPEPPPPKLVFTCACRRFFWWNIYSKFDFLGQWQYLKAT
jgi:hypothetical protein